MSEIMVLNFKECDGLKYFMEQRWHSNRKDQFPADLKDCIEKFKQIETTLNSEHHPLVNLGAAVNGAGLLTDHGPDHVQTVMKRALNIIGEKRVELLSGYEIFILLLAIHFHDLGNIYGREEHEQKIAEVMEKTENTMMLNIIDKTHIRDIAMAHGGYADELKMDKDTIRAVKIADYRDNILIRPALLAAVLRFADEIADDFSRASKIVSPPENEIYHAYSSALDVNIKGDTVFFRYRIKYDYTQRKLQKGSDMIYLYDEIKIRLEKCLNELEYCRKYSDGFIGITTLSVTIYLRNHNDEYIDAFRLRLHGYPTTLKIDNFIERLEQDGTVLTGQKLKFSSGEELMEKIRREINV